ncbi:MAG: cytochrome c oxidase assembly protein [Ktedonobacterales bacterium]|nr:cytochrome c oxidase assembly protein [Ktedonobacterales bacterium]
MDRSSLLVGWSFEPLVTVPLLLTGLLYWRGVRYSHRRGLARHLRWWRAAAFLGGLGAILIALTSSVAPWAGQLLWVHMIQHDLLVMVAAPLLLLSAPVWPLWRALPLPWRRVGLGWVIEQGWPRRWWHVISRAIGAPAVALILFTGVFSVWHLPSLYDQALEQQPIHDLEHVLFMATALLFWAQIIPSRPLRPRLGYVWRAMLLVVAGIELNILAFALALPNVPSYAHYAALPRPAGMISALLDQHMAAGVMDVPGTILFFGTVWGLLALWLRDDERAGLEGSARPGIST